MVAVLSKIETEFHLLSCFQTIISCTKNTTSQTLLFFAEFHFTRILQDASQATCAPKEGEQRAFIIRNTFYYFFFN